MKVIEKIVKLEDEIHELYLKYCGNCQEYDCDFCLAEIEEGEEEGEEE